MAQGKSHTYRWKALGKAAKEQLTPYQKRKQKKERNQRNLVEGKIGQGKNGYGLNKIKARRQDTSESWIGAIFFVMNLVNMVKVWGEKSKYVTGVLLILSFAYQIFLSFLQWIKKQFDKCATTLFNIIPAHASVCPSQ